MEPQTAALNLFCAWAGAVPAERVTCARGSAAGDSARAGDEPQWPMAQGLPCVIDEAVGIRRVKTRCLNSPCTFFTEKAGQREAVDQPKDLKLFIDVKMEFTDSRLKQKYHDCKMDPLVPAPAPPEVPTCPSRSQPRLASKTPSPDFHGIAW